MAEESTNNPARRTERIGKYEILGHIATGGMGVIYKARDVDLDRVVALKVLPADLAAQQMTLVRFEREARAAARLRHENIVAIFDVGEDNGTHFIALEYIEGTDLQDYISRKCRLDPDEARQIMIQATRALVHAHENGIVHRDIKPSNFLLMHKDNRLIVKLTDFGLAIRQENDAEFRIMRDKTTVGTVDYMSPEQARDSRSADIRSDIYSLGCTFYHMLAGLAPFGKGTLPERIIQHMQVPAPDVRKLNKSVPDYLVAIINRMLAKKPDDRYQNPTALLHDLENPDKVAGTGKRNPATGKLERGPGRKQVIDPTMVIDKKAVDQRIQEPKPVKNSKPKKIVSPPVEVRTKDEDEPPPRNDYEEPMEPLEAETSAPEISIKKKSGKGPPVWIIVAAGSVAVLGIVLIVTLIFGGRTPRPKDIDKPPDPPPIVVLPLDKPIEKPVVLVESSAAKMTVARLELPNMDARPDRVDRAALRKEYYGPFNDFPEAPTDATILRMSRLSTAGPTSFRTLADAFKATNPDEYTIIEIHDNGPIYVPALPAVVKRSILVRGAQGYRPLVVWDVPKKSTAPFCMIAQGKLALDNLDFVIRCSDDALAVTFDLPDSDFHAQDCTFSIAGKSKEGIALLRRHHSKTKPTENRATQTWLKRCYVRGSDLCLLRVQETSGAVLFEDSLIVGYQYPLIDMRGRDSDSLDLYCVRSTMVAGRFFLRWGSQSGKGVSPAITGKMLDSIVSRDDTIAPPGDMIHLADDAEPRKMNWRAANTVYAGWKQLLASNSRSIAGNDLEKWHGQWFYREGDRAVIDTWPKNPPSGLEDQSADEFLPGQSPVAYAALSGAGAIGCVIGWLPPVPDKWLERTFEPRTLPIIPLIETDVPRIESAADGLYYGERIDLTKVADFGAYLNAKLQKENPAPRVVVHLAGKGPQQTSPLRIKGVQHLVLYFEPTKDFRDALTLEANPTGSVNPSPLIDMSGGHLEMIGARIRLSPVTLVPTMIQVQGGNLTLTRCWLQGPHTRTADGFLSLINVTNTTTTPATLLMRDNILVASKLLIRMQEHVQLKARNNVFLALGDAIRIDANGPTMPMLHLLEHNTFAVRQTFFNIKTGPEFQAVDSVLLHCNSNAFLHPFADETDKSTLMRGVEAWTARGRWSWQGRFNVYDTRLHAYFAGNEKSTVAKQSHLDWQAAWGQPVEQEPLLYAASAATKTITAEGTTQSALLFQLDRLALPAELRGDRNQNPPGADLVGLGVKKK